MADSVRGQILWYELLTTDMKAAEAFYSKVVGWTVAPFSTSPQAYDMFMRTAEAPAAGVMNIPEGMPFPPHWEMYVGVDKLEDAVAHIERLGGKGLGPLIDIPTIGRMRTMMDPQSAVFAIYESASPQPAEAEPQVGQTSWHELMTTDAEAAMKFYSELFGWKPTETMDMGPMGKYHMFGRAFPLGGMMNKPAELAQVPSNWGIYFRVDEINAATERVKANGGQILNGPMEVPGGDFIINGMDPQGAAFSLHAKP
jgi:predicted enzyme related to lactoylglutathione lyase